MIIAGKDDLVAPRFVQEGLRNSIPHSRLVVFEQSRHFPMIEAAGQIHTGCERLRVGMKVSDSLHSVICLPPASTCSVCP